MKTPKCRWIANCKNCSVQNAMHPILGEVPICTTCQCLQRIAAREALKKSLNKVLVLS